LAKPQGKVAEAFKPIFIKRIIMICGFAKVLVLKQIRKSQKSLGTHFCMSANFRIGDFFYLICVPTTVGILTCLSHIFVFIHVTTLEKSGFDSHNDAGCKK
jgi:hypothetical protein